VSDYEVCSQKHASWFLVVEHSPRVSVATYEPVTCSRVLSARQYSVILSYCSVNMKENATTVYLTLHPLPRAMTLHSGNYARVKGRRGHCQSPRWSPTPSSMIPIDSMTIFPHRRVMRGVVSTVPVSDPTSMTTMVQYLRCISADMSLEGAPQHLPWLSNRDSSIADRGSFLYNL
jgi:hypothetical protein